MTAMLRSLGISLQAGGWQRRYRIPRLDQLLILKSKGWMDGVIYFDGYDWKLMDPTLASLVRPPATPSGSSSGGRQLHRPVSVLIK